MTIIDPGTDNVETAGAAYPRPVRQALCCACGNLRTVSANASPRNYRPEGVSPEHIARCYQYAPNFWANVKPWERLLEDLKCTPCGKVTRHAALRDDEHRDYAEKLNAASDRLVADATRALESLGARVALEEFTINGRTGTAEITRFLDDGTVFVTLNPAVHRDTVVRRAREIVELITRPDEARWFVGVTDDGFPYATVAWAVAST